MACPSNPNYYFYYYYSESPKVRPQWPLKCNGLKEEKENSGQSERVSYILQGDQKPINPGFKNS